MAVWSSLMNVTSPSFRTLGHFLDTKWTRKEVHVASYALGFTSQKEDHKEERPKERMLPVASVVG